MTALGEADSSLASQCLALCQALTSQGKAFNFSLNIAMHWLNLLLLPGYPEQGGPWWDQEEGQPLYPEEKHQAQRRVFAEKVKTTV